MNVKEIPNKGFILQMFCNHDFKSFYKPIDRKTNPMGFLSLNEPKIITICVKCGKEKK